MKCLNCGYLSRSGTCDVCDSVNKEVPDKKVYRIRKVSDKQREVKKKDQEFYKECWEKSNKKCEECGVWLGLVMKPEFISHIESKGAYNHFRHDIRNYNILCLEHHTQWETGDRENMKIYPKNKEIMEQLIKEYYSIKNLKLK